MIRVHTQYGYTEHHNEFSAQTAVTEARRFGAVTISRYTPGIGWRTVETVWG